MGETLSLSITNQLAELPHLMEQVDAFLQSKNISRETANCVQIALDELIANVIRWGYDDDKAHSLQIKLTIEPTELRMIIEDDGRPFDPTTFPPPDTLLKPNHRSEGGLGIHLVRNMADMTYHRIGDRNVVELRIGKNL